MISYQDLLIAIGKYGSNDPKVICKHCIGVDINDINENVILAPWWEPNVFDNFGESFLIQSGTEKVWNITCGNKNFTYIKTGIGAPVLMEVVLALGLTKCKKILFVGSAGALDLNMRIGDIVIPQYSICGDGASTYIGNHLGDKTYPCPKFNAKLINMTETICCEHIVNFHVGFNYSIDTIFAQFYHLDKILALGCNTIEMETSAAFTAAKLCDISIAALFSISDNTLTRKSLISGRSDEEMEYRAFVRRKIFPEIIMKVL